MTIRELTFVYPFINTIAQSKELSATRRVFIETLRTKLEGVISQGKTKEFDLIVKHGQRDPNDNERFKLKTEQQNKAFKQEMSTYRDEESDVKLTKEEEAICERYYYDSIVAGYEDFPEV